MQLSGDKISDNLTRLPPFGETPHIRKKSIHRRNFRENDSKIEKNANIFFCLLYFSISSLFLKNIFKIVIIINLFSFLENYKKRQNLIFYIKMPISSISSITINNQFRTL